MIITSTKHAQACAQQPSSLPRPLPGAACAGGLLVGTALQNARQAINHRAAQMELLLQQYRVLGPVPETSLNTPLLKIPSGKSFKEKLRPELARVSRRWCTPVTFVAKGNGPSNARGRLQQTGGGCWLGCAAKQTAESTLYLPLVLLSTHSVTKFP